MSEKEPFDAAIKNLRMTIVQIKEIFPGGNSVTESHEAAVRVLAFVPTIRQALVDFIEWGAMTGSDLELHRSRFRAFLESLPDPEEERK